MMLSFNVSVYVKVCPCTFSAHQSVLKPHAVFSVGFFCLFGWFFEGVGKAQGCSQLNLGPHAANHTPYHWATPSALLMYFNIF